MKEEKFFDVRTRLIVLIDVVWKYVWIPTTRPDKPRYAVCGRTDDGRVLTKFVTKQHYDKLDVPIKAQG